MRTLEELVQKKGPFGVRDALGWVLRAGLALWELHASGTPHGQVSPAAIEVAGVGCENEGRILSADALDDAPAYHSVARADGAGPSLADDVWALGITLYFLLTGELPYPSGVIAAIDSGRVRPPRPLAVHRAELDVMQPVLDRLIRADNENLATSVEDVVFGLRDFSPTIADLPPLHIDLAAAPPSEVASEQPLSSAPPSSRESHGGADGPARRSRRRRTLDSNLLYGASAVLIGVVVFVAITDKSDPAPVETPSGNASAAKSVTTTTVAAAPTSSTPAPPPLPEPAASASVPSPSPAPPPTPAPESASSDLVACTSAMFPKDAFASADIAVDFPCSVRDAKKGVVRITKALMRGGGGQATAAAKEWSALGWYQAAAFAVAREKCCEVTEAVTTPRLLGMCNIDHALTTLSHAAARGSDDELADGLDAYRVAIHCALTAGGATYFGQKTPPTTAQAAVFLRMLTRLRASQQ